AQNLLGIINWVRPYLGFTTCPGFVNLIRKLTPEAKPALELVEWVITNRQVYRICPKICVTVFVFIVDLHPTGIIGQWDTQWSDPLHIL
ncbi:POK19 protein, partial [Loxia curvirostra]|nr:POK19 protein [Loxia curvirostra]